MDRNVLFHCLASTEAAETAPPTLHRLYSPWGISGGWLVQGGWSRVVGPGWLVRGGRLRARISDPTGLLTAMVNHLRCSEWFI